MNVDWPPFKNGENDSESASALDCDITPHNLFNGLTKEALG